MILKRTTNLCLYFRATSLRLLTSRASSHIFLQLCTGGDLFTYITDHPGAENRLCEAEAKYMMFQLLKGLKYLHDNMISHRGTPSDPDLF